MSLVVTLQLIINNLTSSFSVNTNIISNLNSYIEISSFSYFTDIILKVRPLAENEVQHVPDKSTLISFLYPAQNQNLIQKLANKKVNAFGKYFLH